MKCVSISTFAQTASAAVLLASLAAAQGYNIDISTGVQVPSPYIEHPLSTFPGAAGQAGHWNTVNTPTAYPPGLNPIVSFGLRDSAGAFTTVTCTVAYPAANQPFENWGVKDISANPQVQSVVGHDPSWGALMLDFQLLPQSQTQLAPITYQLAGLGEGYYDVYTYTSNLPGLTGTTIIDVNGVGPQAVSNTDPLYDSVSGLPVYQNGVTHALHRVYIKGPSGGAPGTILEISATTGVDSQLIGQCIDYPAPWPNCAGNPGAPHPCGGTISGIQVVPVPYFQVMCTGDVAANCPCGNNVPLGTVAGCISSFGYGGTLLGAGQPSIAANTFVLNGSNLGNNNPALTNTVKLLASRTPALVGTVFLDDGALCLGGTLIRMGNFTTTGGAVAIPVPTQVPNGSGQLVPVLPGEFFYYQIHYRDVNPTFCTSGLGNTSNMVSAYWVP